jgi:hypothetical protein
LVHAPVGAQETHTAKPKNLAMMAKLLGTLILPIIAVLTILTHLSGAENLGESHPEIVVTRENSIRKSNISCLAIEA